MPPSLRSNRREAVLRLGALFLLPAVACAAGPAAAFAQGEVNVYSSRHYDVDKEINEAFTKATGIKVNVVSVKEAAQLVERMKAEGKRSPADVLMTVDVANLHAAQDAGLFQPMAVPETAKVPAHLRDTKDEWTAVSFRARVIAFDKRKVKPEEVATYEALSEPKWKGRVLVRTSNHVYNQSLVSSLVAAHGEAKAEIWARGVTENLARKPEGGDTDQLKAIAAERGDVAIVNSYYVARLLGSDKPEDKEIVANLGVSFPNQADRGTHINVSGVGVVKSAPNAAAARKYVGFWLTPEVQAKLATANHEYPAVPGVAPSAPVTSFGEKKFDTTPLSKVAANTPASVRLLDRAGWR